MVKVLLCHNPNAGNKGHDRDSLEAALKLAGHDVRYASVKDGEFVCLLGPSGCGKSTLMQIIAGFLPATSGTVLIDDKAVTKPDPKRIFVFQERGVFPWLTVEDNIGFGLSGLSKADRAARIAEYVEKLKRVFPHWKWWMDE